MYVIVKDNNFVRYPPTKIHTELVEASIEAKRLAELNKGISFGIWVFWNEHKVQSTHCIKCNHLFTIYEPNFCGNCGAKR